jgi:multidrug efflux pump subunit AcrA (membrane-fusion protein)
VVDATITGQLPATARPAVEITATILVNQIDNALVITRPVSIGAAKKELSLFVKSNDGEYFERRTVSTGAWSGEHIQILQGLKAEDVVVISNTKGWQNRVKSKG